MKKKIISSLLVLVLSMSVFVGCGSKADNVSDNVGITTEVSTSTTETKEETHEHNYTEAVTTEATCETDGVKTFTCECGDSYDEVITATGHVFESYTSNNDATYTADGTETAKCSNCDVTDTRTAEGSMLTYTYTDMNATMYAQQTVNVRNMPNTDGEKLGGLNTNDEIKVTGQCVETGWYRIEFDGNVAYVSNNYLANDKVVVEQPKAEEPAQNTASEFPYELWTMYNNGTIAWFYMPGLDHGYPPEYGTAYSATSDFNHSHITSERVYDESGKPINTIRHGWNEAVAAAGGSSDMTPTSWYVNGKRVHMYFAW